MEFVIVYSIVPKLLTREKNLTLTLMNNIGFQTNQIPIKKK